MDPEAPLPAATPAPEGGTIGYLVLGPESSGTRMVSQLLVAAGCRMAAIVGGDDGPELPLEGRRPVIRRSAPHWRPQYGPHEWPDVPTLSATLAVSEPRAVVTTRDWFAMATSQVERGHVPDEPTAFSNLRRAYLRIFRGLADARVPFVVSSYEAFVGREAYRRRLLQFLELPPADLDVFDANDKWYTAA